jgi:hypothetical protein
MGEFRQIRYAVIARMLNVTAEHAAFAAFRADVQIDK